MAYPDETELTTVETVKKWLNITGTASDIALTSLIARVSGLLFHLTNKSYLLSREYKDVFSGKGSSSVKTQLNILPITAITSVTIDTTVIPAATPGGVDAGYLFDSDYVYLRGYEYTQGVNNIAIVYTGGLATSGREWGMLEQACLEAINFKWERKEHPDRVAENMGAQITGKFSEEDLPKEVITAVSRLSRWNAEQGVTTIVTP